MSKTAAIQIDLRGTTEMDILINKGHSFSLILEHYEDDGTTPINLTGSYKMDISSDVDGLNVVMELSAGSGLDVNANQLIIDRSVIYNTLQAGTYYFDIRNDQVGDKSLKPYAGRLIVSKTITPK